MTDNANAVVSYLSNCRITEGEFRRGGDTPKCFVLVEIPAFDSTDSPSSILVYCNENQFTSLLNMTIDKRHQLWIRLSTENEKNTLEAWGYRAADVLL